MTKTEEKEVPYLFNKATVEQLPLHFRFMKRQQITAVEEMYSGFRFSRSHMHRASQYITVTLYKPLSDIIITSFTETEPPQ
jgi:hypothetical protein